MMNKIKKPENALKWINNALKKKEVVMGFGHRVYKSGDSRVPTMKEYFKKVARIKKDKNKRVDSDNMTDIEKMDEGFNGNTYSINGKDVDF